MIHEGIRKLKLEKYPAIHLDDRVKELAAFRDTLSVEVAPYDALVTVVLDLKEMEKLLRMRACSLCSIPRREISTMGTHQ